MDACAAIKCTAFKNARFIGYTGGIVVTLLAYGLCQERIMTRPFDGDAYFNHSLLLVLCNRLTTIAVAAATLVWSSGFAAMRPTAPLRAYASVSLANVVATSCQYEALKYVSFGAQTLSKCLKPVPVMAWGALWLRRKYGRADVATAVAVMAGCWLFMDAGTVAHRAVAHKAGHAAVSHATAVAHLFGGGLLAVFLAADGLTSTLQARMFDKGPDVSVANQVLYVSLCSCGFSLAGLALQTGKSAQQPGISAALAFCAAHPSIALWIAALSASATASSLLISATVRHYGALVLSLTMTVRQLASVLVSSATYGQPLTSREAAGMVIVFGALFSRAASKARHGGTDRQSSLSPGPGGTAQAHVSLPMPLKNKPVSPVNDKSDVP